MAAGRTGVMLINTGSPAAPTPEAVKAYLAEFLMDGAVRPMPAVPWWLILHGAILPRRKHASACKYEQIWTAEGSPLLVAVHHLAARVEAALRGSAGVEAPLVRAAMSYGEPSVRSVAAQLKEAGCTRLVVVPLYPQSAFSTTGAATARVRRALAALRWEPEVITVDSYGDQELYVQALGDKICSAGFDASCDRVMFSFHSVPEPDVRAGDSYPEQAQRTCEAVAERLGLAADAWSVSFQSPFEDARTWHGPFTTQLIGDAARVASARGGRTFLICPGFSIDCLETLYDVEHEFKPAYAAAAGEGAAPLVYVPCLNADDAAVDLMAHIVRDVLAV